MKLSVFSLFILGAIISQPAIAATCFLSGGINGAAAEPLKALTGGDLTGQLDTVIASVTTDVYGDKVVDMMLTDTPSGAGSSFYATGPAERNQTGELFLTLKNGTYRLNCP